MAVWVRRLAGNRISSLTAEWAVFGTGAAISLRKRTKLFEKLQRSNAEDLLSK
jgi:hypothetical protein